MVTLPPDFVSTRYPGYFWSIERQQLYSLKPSGVLYPMKATVPSYWNQYVSGYKVSNNGRHRYLLLTELQALQPGDSVIPIADKRPQPKHKRFTCMDTQ